MGRNNSLVYMADKPGPRDSKLGRAALVAGTLGVVGAGGWLAYEAQKATRAPEAVMDSPRVKPEEALATPPPPDLADPSQKGRKIKRPEDSAQPERQLTEAEIINKLQNEQISPGEKAKIIFRYLKPHIPNLEKIDYNTEAGGPTFEVYSNTQPHVPIGHFEFFQGPGGVPPFFYVDRVHESTDEKEVCHNLEELGRAIQRTILAK